MRVFSKCRVRLGIRYETCQPGGMTLVSERRRTFYSSERFIAPKCLKNWMKVMAFHSRKKLSHA